MNITHQIDTLSRHEKAEFLRTNATNIKEGFYFKKFTEDELNEKKDTLVDTCINIDIKEEQFSDVKKTWSEEIKAIKKERSTLTSVIKQKGEDAEGEIFEFADHESGYMVSFDIDGNEINRRRLRPEEKQPNLFIHSQKAS
jgi:hypothetical protein